MAGLDTDYNGYVIRFLSMTDLTEKGRESFLKGQKVVGLGLDAEGRKLGVLMESVNDDTEPKGAATPQGLTGLALEESRLKNDGKTSLFHVYRVSDGSKLSDHKIYYSPSSSGWKMAFSGDSALLVNYSNVNAKVAPSGEVTLFGLDNSFNYGTGFSPDQNVLMTGGLATGTRTKAADLGKTLFKIAPVPGWPEYFKGFALNADGTAFGSTSAYRIHRIAPNGMVEKSAAVY